MLFPDFDKERDNLWEDDRESVMRSISVLLDLVGDIWNKGRSMIIIADVFGKGPDMSY